MASVEKYVWPVSGWSVAGTVFAALSALGIVAALAKGQLTNAITSFIVSVLMLALVNYLSAIGYGTAAWAIALLGPLVFVLLFVLVLVRVVV